MAVLTLERPTATTEELYEKLYRIKGKAEIINGEIIEMPPTGYEPGRAGLNISFRLKEYERKSKRGVVVPDNVAFKVNLPNRKSFSPDSAFHIGEKTGMKFLEGAPVFAVEVRSENDYGKKAEEDIKQKRYDYFAAGTKVVWDVDLLSEETIKSYTSESPDTPQIFRRGEIANAESALPDWTFAVEELFD